ncbi:transposase [Streptomyces sp. NPDC056464]|uniref:transposase n=1 Tax=Streptomyces sp. NPDC056464 TaxID=3345828 RepID=UPI00367A4FAA
MVPVVGADLSKRPVSDELWEPATPLLPSSAARPQGGGAAPCDERAVCTAVVYAPTSGRVWRYLPPTFGTSPATADRRFTVGTEAGLWRRLQRSPLLARPDAASTIAEVRSTSPRAPSSSSTARCIPGTRRCPWMRRGHPWAGRRAHDRCAYVTSRDTSHRQGR